VPRKVHDCCGGRGKHLKGCGEAAKRGPHKPHKDPVQAIENTARYEKCPPHAPFEWGSPDRQGRHKHQCSKCARQLGKW
jgi:hypothetical protein